MCVMRTAESVLLTCWPPAPEARYVSMRRSPSSISTSTSSSTQGVTSTRAKAVCRRCAESNGDSRTSRCTPFSAPMMPYAFSPSTSNETDLRPASSPGEASSSSLLKPRRSAQRRYMRNSISAQSIESVPPAPALIVTTAGPASYSPEKRAPSSNSSMRWPSVTTWVLTSSASSGASASITTRSAASSTSVLRLSYSSSLRAARVRSAETLTARSWSSQKPGVPIWLSSSPSRSCSCAGSK